MSAGRSATAAGVSDKCHQSASDCRGFFLAVVPVLGVAVWSGLPAISTRHPLSSLQRARERSTLHRRSWTLDFTPDGRIGDFRLSVGNRPYPTVARTAALPTVRRLRAGGHGCGIGCHLIAAASRRDRLPAAMHAAADDFRLALEGSPVWLGMSALALLFTCCLWAAAWKLNSSISTMLQLKMETEPACR